MDKKYAEDRLVGAKRRLEKSMTRRNDIQNINIEEYEIFYDLWYKYRLRDILKEMDETCCYSECYHDNVIEFPSPEELQTKVIDAQYGVTEANKDIRKYKKELGEIKITEKDAKGKKLAEISEKTGVSISDVKKILKEAK